MFSNGAVDVYDTANTFVMNTTFEHNGPVNNVFKTSYGRYVIHSGGLSIVTDILDERSIGMDTPSIVITHCTFVNNSAIPNDNLQQSTTQVFVRALLNGRGGGLGIALVSRSHSYIVYISNCSFISNRAKRLGGGIYFVTGRRTSHNMTLNCSIFLENESDYAAGGSFISSFGSGIENAYDNLVVNECLYDRNVARRGGASGYNLPGQQGYDHALEGHVIMICLICNAHRYKNNIIVGLVFYIVL